MEIGKRIKLERIKKGLTQGELGTLIGVQASAVAKYENGKCSPGINKLKMISDALDIQISDLVGEPKDSLNKYIDAVIDDKIFTSITKINDNGEFFLKFEKLSPEAKQKMEEYMDLLLKAERI